MTAAIAIVGMACRYPDARSPSELWENVLAKRRAFRRMPANRLRLEDYFSADRAAPDQTYATEAALIEGYHFDRMRFRVAGSTYRSADLAHWLALEVAADALADAGYAEAAGLPRDTTGVLLGNTLTGEFSRASVMRLRWPYVRRVVEAALAGEGLGPGQRRAFLERLEQSYKEPFAPVGEETLAGGLSNTIAGRICNYFDLHGGGYTVDGACASSLLAITNACTALVAGDLDVALAGGVDLSLDPFELVGFAKTGALAAELMRVYDQRSNGFWPGEGCGIVVLMRYADAVVQGRRVYGVIRGWGVSSDGSGGITRPEVAGQLLAVRRAYVRAGFGIETVAYFEGHGTGTNVGDTTELRMLTCARREADADAPPAVIGSIKANIGHTKAAAGVAGLIKATLALHHQILPPTTGYDEPHAELSGDRPALQLLSSGALWPADRMLRAAVSAMGFGGINSHIVLESDALSRRSTLSPWEHTLLSSAQDSELLLLSAHDQADLRRQIVQLAPLARQLARAELADLAARLQAELSGGPVRAAIVVTTPQELAARLETLLSWLDEGISARLDSGLGLFLGSGAAAPRIGFLFPGQGSPAHLGGGIWRSRFAGVQELYALADLPVDGDTVATAVAQPAIVTASLAGLRTLSQLGIRASLAVGHSLGELTALHWAGALDEPAVIRLAAARGRAMADLGSPTGAMASIEAAPHDVRAMLNGDSAVIAGLNAPRQTVISGDASTIALVVARAQARGTSARQLAVSHAFHSPLVAGAQPALAAVLQQLPIRPLQRPVYSTVTGAQLGPDADLRALLVEQITAPVRFVEAATVAAAQVDLLIEVGPGRVLSGLAGNFVTPPVIALNAGGPSLAGLWKAIGAAFVLGTPIEQRALSAGRFTRPLDLTRPLAFFTSPCELAPIIDADDSDPAAGPSRAAFEPALVLPEAAPAAPALSAPEEPAADGAQEPVIELFRRLVAERAELPLAMVCDDSHLLNDLHLNSIAVSELVARAARQLGLGQPITPTDYADATVAQVAEGLAELASTSTGAPVLEEEQLPSGVDIWIGAFSVELVEQPRRPQQVDGARGPWQVLAPSEHPQAAALQQALTEAGGRGVVVWLPPDPDQPQIELLLSGAHLAIVAGAGARFVLVQHGGGAASFARTLHVEQPRLITCVVDLPRAHPDTIAWIVAEALAADGYSEAHYDEHGRRRVPMLRQRPLADEPAAPALGPDDVLLVSGGGKGITAECALRLARDSGARLGLLGRAQPAEDAGLAANLARMDAAGIRVHYVAVDVTDGAAVREAVATIEAELGPITGLLHGAARNVPGLITALDQATIQATLAPKVEGLRNLLAAVDPDRLRLLITFGSIIARIGLRGEADYALANEWLTRLTEQWQAAHPACRCLALEWSVWADVGMGARIAHLETLMRGGIVPIPLDRGLALLERLVSQPQTPTALVVAGRFGEPPTLAIERPHLPFLRFLEQPRVHYPGIELVIDAELSVAADPYLDEHIFAGQRLFPAVLGLEAMAQTAMALAERDDLPAFEAVSFDRAIVVAGDAPLTIRVAALLRGPGQVELALRSKETAFQVDHFRAICRFDLSAPSGGEPAQAAGPALDLDPARDLYGGLLFHRGRFQRLAGYQHIAATACLAQIAPASGDWFGRYLPPTLVLGDPGARDATIHAIQVCVPNVTLLPIGVERLVFGDVAAEGPWQVAARERRRDGDVFTYDVEVWAATGQLRERWEGLQLRVINGSAFRGEWVAPLLGPYVERRIGELIPGAAVTIAIEHGAALNRRARSDRAIQRALGQATPIWRRPDGKPEIDAARQVSAAHAGAVTLAVAAEGPLGCDIEPVESRPSIAWQELLGTDRWALVQEIVRGGADEASAATRVWSACECLKKAGVALGAPLQLATVEADGWIVLRSGTLSVATFVAPVRDCAQPLALAVLTGGESLPARAAPAAHGERYSMTYAA